MKRHGFWWPVLLALAALVAAPQAFADACEDGSLADCIGRPPTGIDFLDADPMAMDESLVQGVHNQATLIRALKARLRRNPSDADATMDLGLLAAQSGDGFAHYFERAEALVDDDSNRRRRLAWARGHACAAGGDAECALRHWHAAASAFGGDARWVPAAYSYALWGLGRTEQAIDWYAAAVRADARLGRGEHAALVGVGTELNRLSRDLFSAWAERYASKRTTIVAEVDIDTDGRIARLLIPEGRLDAFLLQRVRLAVLGWRFEPVKVADGRAVTLSTHLFIEVRAGATDDAATDLQIQYAGMGPEFVNRPMRYPALALRQQHEGTVVLRVAIRPDGSAGEIELVESSGSRHLDRGARDNVANWTFKPNRLDGEPVETHVLLPIQFRLSDRPDTGGMIPYPVNTHTRLLPPCAPGQSLSCGG